MSGILESLGLNWPVLLAQLFNIVLLIVVFKYFIWDSVIKEIRKKRELIKKLENADKHYDEMIAKAEDKAAMLIKEWTAKKDAIIAEAWSVGEKRKEDLIAEGHQKAKIIIENAETKASKLESEMENQFEESVKTVSMAAINKLLWQKKDLEEEYIQNIIKEVKTA